MRSSLRHITAAVRIAQRVVDLDPQTRRVAETIAPVLDQTAPDEPPNRRGRVGRQAIEIIENTPGLSVVLMDIMMPDMDGYETMREIRNNPEFTTLPILALTAKAMKGDREKCLQAGASDYISKPVNTDQLLSLLRVWLHR